MAAVTTSCGHAAQLLAFSNLCQPGDNFIATNKLYGGSVSRSRQELLKLAQRMRAA